MPFINKGQANHTLGYPRSENQNARREKDCQKRNYKFNMADSAKGTGSQPFYFYFFSLNGMKR